LSASSSGARLSRSAITQPPFAHILAAHHARNKESIHAVATAQQRQHAILNRTAKALRHMRRNVVYPKLAMRAQEAVHYVLILRRQYRAGRINQYAARPHIARAVCQYARL